jgi:hypothetical protein
MAELSIFNVSVKDDASTKIVRITKKLQAMEAALERQLVATKSTAEEMVRYDAAMAGAISSEIKHIESLQNQIAASKQLAIADQERIASAIAAEKQQEQVRAQALQSNISSIDRAAASQKKKQQDDQKAQQATDNLVAALRDEAATYGMTRDQIEIYRLEQSKATDAQIQSVKAAQLQRTDAIKNQKEMQGVTKHLRFMRGGFGQVGYQIQDMAVQAQMGTNSMIILGQQGSQVASLFGPGGAMIGAVLAVVAALSTVLIPNLFGASKAMKKVEDDQKKLIENFDKLDAVLRKTALADAEQQIANFESTIKDANEILKTNIALSERWQKITDSGAGSTEDNEKAQKRFNKAIDEQRVIIKIAAKNIDELKEKTNGQANAANKLVEKLQLSTKQFNYSDKQMAEYEATQAGATGGTKNLIVYLKLLEIALAKKKKKDDEATQAIKDNQKAVDDMNKSLAEEIAMFGKSAAEIAVRNAALKGATFEEQEAIRVLAEHKQGLIDKDKADKKSAETSLENKKSLDDMVLSLADELAQVNMSATAIRVYNAAKLGANETTLEAIRLMGEEFAAQELLKTKREDAAKSFADLQQSSIEELESPADKIQREYEEKIAKIVEYEALANAVQAEADAERLAAQKIFTDKSIKLHDDIVAAQLAATSSVLSSFQGQISGMAGFLEEGSAIGKAFYVAQQAMAAGMAIIKGYEAAASITAAMAMMGPTGVAAAPAMATAAISMGYVTAAMIAGQTLASFEGGGHVGGRSRSGGMDNKGGVLAMLHPNESVIDHTKGQSSGITIINNIDAGGAGADVDMKIRQAVTQATTASVATIQDLMRRRRFA